MPSTAVLKFHMPTKGHQSVDSDDAGYSLIELLVAMMIVLVVIAGTTVVLISTTTSSRTSIARAEADRDMALVTEAFSRAVRVAVVPPVTGAKNPFEVAQENRIVFYAATERGGLNPTTAPVKYDFGYRTSDKCITETRTMPVINAGVVSWPAAQASTRCITQSTHAPKFTYLQAAATTTPPAGAPTSGGTTPGALLKPLPDANTTSLASAWAIRAASITTLLDSNRADQKPTETTVTVALVHGSN